MSSLKGLYVITDEVLTPKETMLKQVEAALRGGAKIVQLRNKNSDFDEIRQQANQLQYLCSKYNAKFILNDHIALAIELNCDGLHVGKSDHHRIDEIRKQFQGILGVSCYGNIVLAEYMQSIGVDYVAFGSFYTSPTKPAAEVVPKTILKEAKKRLNIPLCAIGGINTKNMHELLPYNVDMLAIISDIWKSQDIEEKVKQYTQIF